MSLRLRLALWYGGLTGLVVILTSLIGYAVHSRVHYDDFDRGLAAAAEHLAIEYVAASPGEQPGVLATALAAGLAARVYDGRGQAVAESPNASAIPPIDPARLLARSDSDPFGPVVALAPRLVGRVEGDGRFGLVERAPDDRWRLYLLPVAETDQQLLVALPLGEVDRSVRAFRDLMPALALGGAVVGFVVSGLLAGRALRPVAVVTETAGSIARSRGFSKRVRLSGSRDELGRLEHTFNEMLESLEQAYRAQQRFVGDASHELRAPLTAIQANLELLERQPAMSAAERQEAIREATREAHRLVQLVADLLALARADAGLELRRQRVELDRVLLDAAREARLLARGQRIEIGELEPVVLEGDPDRLKQLFLVLLDNAIKYSPADQEVRLALKRRDGTAEASVHDNGVGIAADELERVFERFYRTDPARARDPGGTGLGLPIARWIAEQHGGRLQLDSAAGRGTTATLYFPLRDD